YNPSKAAAGIFGALYGIATFIIIFRLFASRAWWGLCLPIGTSIMTAGFWTRIAMTIYPNSMAIFLCSALFILLSPAAFLAFNYILYGQFIVTCVHRRHSLIKPERTSWYFVISDTATFLIQSIGGSMLSSTDPNTNKIGAYVVIGGLALQTLSFGCFMLLVYHAYSSLKRHGIKPLDEPWGIVLKILFFTSTFFMVRCIYRTIELGQGLGSGYLASHEGTQPFLMSLDFFFYVFDSLPLLIGISAYAVYWPTRYLYSSLDTPSGEMSTMIPSDSEYEYGS
ncbi:hypothetical protein BS17DRAFT_716919, partial [Gyrodon lividus]